MSSSRFKKAAFIVSETAANRIKSLLSSQATQPIGIRLGVRKRGCNGLSYTMNYVKPDEATKYKTDEVIEEHGVKVFIDPKAIFFVVGTTMDYVDTDIVSEFTFKNPNSKGSCGCGESFNV